MLRNFMWITRWELLELWLWIRAGIFLRGLLLAGLAASMLGALGIHL